MTLSLIAAVARNGVVGKDNALLWHLPEDMRFFRESTRGATVIMGRRTWESLPPRFRPLPGRRNIVLTRNAQWHDSGAEPAPSLDAALALAASDASVFVIGGAEVWAQALGRADRLLLTEIDRDFEGDVRFPAWPREDFEEAWRTHHDSGQDFGYERAEYRRR